ncbi:ABC transporter permease [uncultured Corynebacterium sp.]|uniref:ABC transporter permease n=1 Tax=uncultured Corynebacterium sp. TaxID=159447 RepID=UPI0025993BCF|nr:ABC transporter permease [uncultured Corynebacterium sp.]
MKLARIELHKMKRTRVWSVAVVVAAAVSAVCAVPSATSAHGDEAWRGLMLGYAGMCALVSPLFTAILASRQTDMEHGANGWNLYGSAGYRLSALLTSKLSIGAVLLALTVSAQTVAVVSSGIAQGLGAGLDGAMWSGYAVRLWAVDMAFLSFHLIVAATVRNQLVVLGLGTIGSFTSFYSLLAPADLLVLKFFPPAYFAQITPLVGLPDGFVEVDVPDLWVGAFLAASFTVFLTFSWKGFERVQS